MFSLQVRLPIKMSDCTTYPTKGLNFDSTRFTPLTIIKPSISVFAFRAAKQSKREVLPRYLHYFIIYVHYISVSSDYSSITVKNILSLHSYSLLDRVTVINVFIKSHFYSCIDNLQKVFYKPVFNGNQLITFKIYNIY